MSHSSSKKIGVLTATIVGMNAMIGAGIFAIPSTLGSEVGPAGIVTFLIAAFSVWCMAQSLSRVAALYPEEGSFYVYAKQWGGHTVGLLASGAYLIGLLIAMGLLAHSAGIHFVRYIPGVSAYSAGLATLVGLTLLNMAGVSLSSLGQQILIVLTVFPLLATTLLCLGKANPHNLVPFAPCGIGSIFSAIRIVIFAFFGFEATASLFSIIEDPQKNLPKAITYAVIGVSVLYLSFALSLLVAVPTDLFKLYPGPISGPLSHIFPHQAWILELIHIASISAILGTLHSMIWSSGALLLSFIKKIHSSFTQRLLAHQIITPRTSTLLIGLAIFTSFSLLTNNMFFNLTSMFLMVAFELSMITLLTVKSEWSSGRNIITIAGIVTGLMVFYIAASDCFLHITQPIV